MSKKGTTDPEAQWRALRAIAQDDMLDPDYPEELIDAELRAAGADPDEIGREGEAFVAKLLAERAEAASRKASGTRLRSTKRLSTSSRPPSTQTTSTLPPMRAKAPSDADSQSEE